MRLPNLKSENFIAILNIAATIIIAGINFFTIPIFTRLMSTESYGIVNIYVTWVQIFTIFIGLKCDGSIASAKANIEDDKQDSYQYSILLMSLVSFGVILAICYVIMNNLIEWTGLPKTMCILMLVQSFGAYIVSFFNMRFIFRKEALYNFILSIIVCISTTVLSVILICVIPDFGAMGRVLGLAIPNALIAICLFANFLRKRPGFSIEYWKFCLPLTLPLIFHGLSQLALSQVNKISLQHFCDYSAVGIFSLGVTVAGLIGMMYNALNNAYVPFYYDDLAGKNSKDTKLSHFYDYLILFTSGTAAFVLLAPEILKIMATESYFAAIDCLPLLIIGQYCVFLYSFPVNYEFYLKKTISIAMGTGLAALENALLSVLLVPGLGIIGASIASSISYFSLFIFHFLIARYKYGDHNFTPAAYFGGFLIICIFAAISYLLDAYIAPRWLIGLSIMIIVLIRCIKNRRIF